MPGKGRKRQKRARKGTGTIYEYRPGRFRGMVDLGVDSAGKRIRKSATGNSEKEVQQKLDQFKQDAWNGLPIQDDKITVAQHVEDWLRSKRPSIRSSTYTSYQIQVNTHILPALGHLKLKSLDYRLINAFYDSLDDKELSRRTIAYIAKVLRMTLNDAVRKRLIPENPANLATKRTPGKSEARYMNQDETAAFLEAAQGERLEWLFSLLLQTGLRPGEALGLPWSAVYLEEAKLTVKQALHEEGENLFLGPVKTRAGRRTISLSQEAISALRRQNTLQKRSKRRGQSSWNNKHDLVFTDQNGGFLRRTNIVRRDMQRIRSRAADQTNGKITLEGVTLHTFRHTHASMLIMAGVDAKTISARLGHENISITFDIYGHIMPGQDENAAGAMDEIMASLRQRSNTK